MREAMVIVLSVLSFAVITAFLYAWGLWRAKNKQQELLAILDRKGRRRVQKALKTGPKTRAELEKSLRGMRASLFYSRNRLTVQDPAAFAADLLQSMVEKGLIQESYTKGKRLYHLAEKREGD